MNTVRITNFIFDTGVYFAAHLSNGGARIGMNGVIALDVLANHALYTQIVALTPDLAEEFIDSQIESGRIDLRTICHHLQPSAPASIGTQPPVFRRLP